MSWDQDPIAEQLADWQRQFTNRRTVPWEMLRLAEGMVETAADSYRRRYDLAIREVRQEHADELQRLREEHDKRVETLRSTIDNQTSTIDRQKTQLEERRSLHEARRSAGDGDSEVTIRRDDHLQAWRLSDLEEIAFRLRCGGGSDDTPVDMASNRAQAVVPAPNLVQLEHRPKPKPAAPPTEASPPGWLILANRVFGSRLTVVAVVVATIAILVGL